MPEFRTLAEEYQLVFSKKSSLVNEANNKGLLKYDTNARIEVFIDELDLKADIGFDEILENSALSTEEKVAQLRQLALEIVTLRIRTAESESGMAITIDGLSEDNLELSNISFESLVEEYNNNKLEDQNV